MPNKPFIAAFIYSLLFASLVNAQKTSDYKYVYRFQLPAHNDTSKLIIDSTQNFESVATLKGKIINNKAEPLPSITISVKNKDSIFYLVTSTDGTFKTRVVSSIYELGIDGVGNKSFQFSIDAKQQLNYCFTVMLAEGKPFDWFDIYSKKHLSEQEIDEIKKCVQFNKDNPSKCRKKSTYYIAMEI